MEWRFDIFQKIAVKFPAHGQIIPVNCNQLSPPRGDIAVHPKAGPKKGTTEISQNKTLQSLFINVAASPKIHVLITAAIKTFEQFSPCFNTLHRIQKPLGESPHFVSLNIPFLVKGTKKVCFISFIQ